jgi:hypothetical protein
MVGTGVREAIVGDRRITGLTPEVIAAITAEIGPIWEQQRIDRLVSRPRSRAVGAGAQYRLVFIDRLLATLVNLRHGITHDALACWLGVDRSTITRAISEIRPLLAARGCSVAPGLRLRTLAEVVDHLGQTGQAGIVDGTAPEAATIVSGPPAPVRLSAPSPPLMVAGREAWFTTVSSPPLAEMVICAIGSGQWTRLAVDPGPHPTPAVGAPSSSWPSMPGPEGVQTLLVGARGTGIGPFAVKGEG